MKAGWKSISWPRAMSRSRRSASRPPLRMYHWREVTTSRGLSPFSKKLTGCMIFFGSPSRSSAAARSSTTASLALKTVLPAMASKCGAAFGGGDPLRGLADDAAVAAHDRAGGQLQLAPPGDVGEVTEGADHGDAGALVRLRERVGLDLHLDAEQGRGDLLAEQRLVPFVVGIRHEGGAGGQQLGAGGLDVDLFAVFGEERVAVVGARDLTVLELGLGHRGAERDIPQGGRLRHVGVAGGEVRQEGALGDGAGLVIDGAVRQVPVHGQAEGLEEVLEDLLVLDGEFLAEFDEVPARDDVEVALVLGGLRRGPVAGVVRGGGVAAHTVVVLHAALGGQAVVVPAHGVEDVLAGHALVARQDVRLGVGEHVADVQRTRRRGRGSVDRVDLLPGGVRVELVGPFVKPAPGEGVFQPLQGGLVRNVDGGGGGRVCTLRVFSHGAILPWSAAGGRSGLPGPAERADRKGAATRRTRPPAAIFAASAPRRIPTANCRLSPRAVPRMLAVRISGSKVFPPGALQRKARSLGASRHRP